MDTRFWNFRMGLLDFLFFDEILNDSIHDAPLDEIELCDGGHETLEFDTGCATKGVKELLRVPVKTRFVGHVDREHLAVRCGICDVLILGVIGDEPFELAQRDAVAMLDNIVKLFLVLWYFEKLGETRQQEFRLFH